MSAVVLPRRAPRLAPITRWTIGALGLALLLAAAVHASRVVRDPLRFPVRQVDVLGTLDYTDRDALRARVAPYLVRGFYALDIGAIRRELETLPWVASARVSRIWPARLAIDVDEHEPAARWNDDALVSKRLVLFRPPQLEAAHARGAEWRALFDSLPRLGGSDGRHAAVLEDFRDYERELAPLGLEPERLEEDARRSQTLGLADGTSVRLGHEERGLRLRRFADVHGRLIPSGGGAGVRFDMRYSNGFALSGADGVKRGAPSEGTVDEGDRG